MLPYMHACAHLRISCMHTLAVKMGGGTLPSLARPHSTAVSWRGGHLVRRLFLMHARKKQARLRRLGL